MNTQEKLEILADAAKYDASCASSGAKRAGNGKGVGHTDGTGICHSYTPDGRCVSLLKILLTNFCTYDCVFCVNRSSSDIRRARFTLRRSSTSPSTSTNGTTSKASSSHPESFSRPTTPWSSWIQVGRLLRVTHSFGGYIHLKAIPGCSPVLIETAGLYADRLSANIELPHPAGSCTAGSRKEVCRHRRHHGSDPDPQKRAG